ncbi:CsbD family protein [Kitasatospora sp. NPDC093806]|uniref:CsbD family protein n=1 Tax=Kitasatospora sp. NPDC093806 TaxID=3155075 RepID=UPI003436B7F3
MATSDKMRNMAEKARGKVKETVGRSTGDRPMEVKGKVEQAKSDLKQAGEKIKDAGKH